MLIQMPMVLPMRADDEHGHRFGTGMQHSTLYLQHQLLKAPCPDRPAGARNPVTRWQHGCMVRRRAFGCISQAMVR